MKFLAQDLDQYPQQRFTFDFKEELPIAEAAKPVVGELTLSRAAYGIKLAGNVKTLLKLSCQSCLRPYFQALSVDIDELFVPYRDVKADFEMGASREKELLKNDFYDEISEDGIIDISDVVYQSITLASPVFCRCGAECPGPPRSQDPGSGSVSGQGAGQDPAEKPIDPRWKNLKTLFPKQE